jgi:chorismate-pyruvate lyase
MRAEIESILRNKEINFFDLDICSRLLLVTDGTVTELLEALVREPVILGYRHQSVINENSLTDSTFLNRTITLQGELSGTHWIYARSRIFLDQLSSRAQSMLIDDSMPIGTILKKESCDNHRQIIDCGFETDIYAAEQLGLAPDSRFLFREYEVISESRTLMTINEWFPMERISNSIILSNHLAPQEPSEQI